MVGETFLIGSKEIRVEIKLWEFSRNLVIKTTERGKLPKRKGVKGDELRTRDSFWQAHGGAVVGNHVRRRERSKNWSDERPRGGGCTMKEETLSDFRNQEPREDEDS